MARHPMPNARDGVRSKKIAALQKLIDEAEDSGPSERSMSELLVEARRMVDTTSKRGL